MISTSFQKVICLLVRHGHLMQSLYLGITYWQPLDNMSEEQTTENGISNPSHCETWRCLHLLLDVRENLNKACLLLWHKMVAITGH